MERTDVIHHAALLLHVGNVQVHGRQSQHPIHVRSLPPTYYDAKKRYIAPAHYTAAETAGWWADVVRYVPYMPVSQFQTNRLINGELGSAVDLNNLTTVREFRGKAPGDGTFTYMPNHSAQPTPLVTAHKAGDVVGLKVFSFPGESTGAVRYRLYG